jgi:hypothetical protein
MIINSGLRDGYIDHLDGDPLNNEVSNLAHVPGLSDHARMIMQFDDRTIEPADDSKKSRVVAQLRQIQDECMTVRAGSSAHLLRAKLNSIADVCAQIIKELGE